jgi:hypothetical protein
VNEFDGYDLATGEWTYVELSFSENVGEYITMFNVIQHIAAFKSAPEPGYAVIFDRIWMPESVDFDAVLKIGARRCELASTQLDDDAKRFLRFATQVIGEGMQPYATESPGD